MSAAPEGAEALAAFLYWQTAEKIEGSGIKDGSKEAKFNGHSLVPVAQALTTNWAAAPAPCWSVAWPGGRKLITYRADVRQFLPIDDRQFLDEGHLIPNPNFNKYVANGSHSVQAPDAGHDYGDDFDHEYGNGTRARALGASLVVIYRDPTMPHRADRHRRRRLHQASLRDDDPDDPRVLPGLASPVAKMTAHRR